MNNNAERSESDEGVERNDVFLYRSEVGNEGESCNVLCLFLFFISLFFVMLMTTDNSTGPTGSAYEGGERSAIGADADGNFMPGEGGDRSTPDDLIDNALIQCLNFKGRYRVEDRGRIHGSDDSAASTASAMMKNDPRGGEFEAKLITLKLSLHNVTKSFLFLFFEPQDGSGGSSIRKDHNGHDQKDGRGAGMPNQPMKQPSKFQFLGMPGLNVNRENTYMFNGMGYNFLTLCQDEKNCICSYNVGIQQNVDMHESTSLREVEESYLYLMKKYLMDEAESFGTYLSARYRDQYERYLSGKVAGVVAEGESVGTDIHHDKVGTPPDIVDTPPDIVHTPPDKVGTPSDIVDTPHIVGNTPHYDGYISSDNCGLFVRLEGNDIDKKYAAAQVTAFSILYNIKSIIELGLFYVQIGRSSENMRSASKVSLLSICLNSFIDLFESLLLLYEVMLSRLLLVHFIFMVLLKFLLFTLMELRYILIIWRANHQQDLQEGWDQLQRKLGALYKFYYGSILLVIVAFYYIFPVCPYILLLPYMCWVPQIMLDIWKGQRNSINLKVVFALSLCRVFLPVYRFMYSQSIFQLDVFARAVDSSNSMFSILLIIILAVQLLFMSLQRLYGPRYLINIDLLPHVHNYYKSIDPNFETGIPECVICMYDIVLKDKKYCVTPCFHIFHDKCLQQWMDVKLECPTCRGALPNFP
ncbi:E3 ubiquitin-protein ligase, putative [Plasmodium knowlesi strain H]|uniref:RING-type E3 ubiquitin transferase n=3 Tax=Plasmodium knowlesi TaxID=5850 RepID=A0A5K1V619_PLAKH|nr:E3 ubiquitin-protein ligase, putative [Plasmodium knowlesi strain H]OTN66063.1 putative E3 ubiquitin-protein ligase [Plasmodium knowlesi]CAA9987944.1 E3 ubiquitin-protein ligase, putative [Plasmodium knowlesi strain H]SBO22189.1 E3 ubiquitin-protein ligase, putative [Plasmodium knowlesi strain H]SBO29197.1 E3 ubiquitin-protein ligase, putative [Plasmodium knowlesi strain H]VVS77418.1 E3 ubiquitin-protein ligase, putative [Plasmodium knowlesi strain H]|eukprot:XP_002258924.1 zinc finger protein, putative [Plasmodium knowlesi strain H]